MNDPGKVPNPYAIEVDPDRRAPIWTADGFLLNEGNRFPVTIKNVNAIEACEAKAILEKRGDPEPKLKDLILMFADFLDRTGAIIPRLEWEIENGIAPPPSFQLPKRKPYSASQLRAAMLVADWVALRYWPPVEMLHSNPLAHLYRWIVLGPNDKVTCEICAPYIGKIFEGRNPPVTPFHFGCRCQLCVEGMRPPGC